MYAGPEMHVIPELFALFLASAAPALPAPPPPAPAPFRAVNLLSNAGFEQGPGGWTHMGGQNWGAFEVVGADVAAPRSGAKSARLVVSAAPGTSLPSSKVFGVVQELRGDQMPGGFPETLAGWYRVDRWENDRPDALLYLQAVVIAWGDPRTQALVPGSPDIRNYQIRFVLAGAERPAFALTNARYSFVSRDPPRRGEWVRFEIPVRRAFQEMWGVVPDGFEFIRVLFEARWDSKPADATIHAVVEYDDLFFGYGTP